MSRKEPERAWIEARKLQLVGSVLAASDQEVFIEATFATHFGAFFRQPDFWTPFELACCAVVEGKPWSAQRQLMLAFSLPQEVNAKDQRVRGYRWSRSRYNGGMALTHQCIYHIG